jgi:hypothetical protein
MKKNTVIALVSGMVFVLCCVCLLFAGIFALAFNSERVGSVFDLPAPDAPPTAKDGPRRLPIDATQTTNNSDSPAASSPSEPAPGAVSEIQSSNAPADAADNLRRLREAVMPAEDLADLAVRFKGVRLEDTKIVCTEARSLQQGATRKFTLSNQDNNTQFEIEARLAYVTEHVYMWVQTDPQPVNVDASALKRAADTFESKIYGRTREFFGSEDQPGVDCDKHVHVLHAQGLGSSVGGYFSSPDGYPRAVRSDSNEGQVFVMHAAPGYNGSDPESDVYLSTVAHEFQHMISFNNNHAPDLWLEEGAAQFAERLNGYGAQVSSRFEFAARPETQLNTWQESSAGSNSAHYGAGYLFWSYLYDRFGEEITRKLARAPERSEQSFMRVLAENGVTNPDTGKALTFEELFADFVIANYMNTTKLEPKGNRFNYSSIRVPAFAERASYTASDYPLNTADTLAQFGTHYVELRGNGPINISFQGDSTVKLLPMSGARGAFWYSNRGDASNPRLTREVDLSGALNATLKFRAWYRIEKDYDYAYVSVSADKGKTWQVLQSKTCTTENPQNANLGCGWNGPSGVSNDDSEPRWIDEEVDLNDYVGKVIQLRFELVTDAGVNRDGVAIDDIEIPEIGFKDDAGRDNGWASEGWVRLENLLPQLWSLQVIITNRDGTRELRRVSIDAVGNASTKIDFSRNGARSAVLVISPMTQVTTETADYQLRIE